MKKRLLATITAITCISASVALAQDIVSKADSNTNEVQDITKELLVGPGTVNVGAIKDIHMSFGGQIRIIPTMEGHYDFGITKNATAGFLNGALDRSFFKAHVNESGWVNNNYIRTEDRLYFNALPKDRTWSFYAALEFDRPLDTNSVDERGGRTGNSNFGLERLHGTMALPFLPFNARLHAGWDVWGLDFGEAAGLVYGDDNPGFWITGEYGPLALSIGYFKLGENNYQVSATSLKDTHNRDRDLIAGYLDYKINDKHKARLFYAYDQIRSTPAYDLLGYLTTGTALSAFGVNKTTSNPNAKTNSHHIGAYYVGNFGPVELFGEGVYQYGDAKDTGLGDFDIAAYALSGDVSIDLKEYIGFSVKPHFGIMYTSGDGDATDNKLNGYQGVDNAQRFSHRWGGENTIIGDTNLVLGTMLYGYLPELHGNGTPIATGGLQNTIGYGAGRGDNPGVTMLSYGVTVTPKKHIIFRTNANSMWWNEDIKVYNYKTAPFPTTIVKSGYVGTEWDNELTLALSKHTFIKTQAAVFFPGKVVLDTTTAMGVPADDYATRFAMEFIWNF